MLGISYNYVCVFPPSHLRRIIIFFVQFYYILIHCAFSQKWLKSESAVHYVFSRKGEGIFWWWLEREVWSRIKSAVWESFITQSFLSFFLFFSVLERNFCSLVSENKRIPFCSGGHLQTVCIVLEGKSCILLV